MNYLYFSDNKIDKVDKYTKLRNIMLMINDHCQKVFPLQQCLDVGETMMLYNGRNPSEQFIREKPIKFGFKDWCLSYSNDSLWSLTVIKEKTHVKRLIKGLEDSVVFNLINELPKYSFMIAIDNYFTFIMFVEGMSNLEFAVVGTARQNRIGKCLIDNMKNLGQKERNTMDRWQICHMV